MVKLVDLPKIKAKLSCNINCKVTKTDRELLESLGGGYVNRGLNRILDTFREELEKVVKKEKNILKKILEEE